MRALAADLGIETADETVLVVLPRETVLPASRRQTFTTSNEGQTSLALQLVERILPHARDNRSDDEVILRTVAREGAVPVMPTDHIEPTQVEAAQPSPSDHVAVEAGELGQLFESLFGRSGRANHSQQHAP